MVAGSTLPKELSLALNFRKLTLRFTHSLFDESVPGHFGLVSQFVLSELYRGSELQHIIDAFPFNIMPIVERLRQFQLIQEKLLTALGKHYAFCLNTVHGKELQAWAHWGRSLKILLPAETQALTDDSPDLCNSLKINAYDKRQRPFAFSRKEHIHRLLGFLVPEYTTAGEAEKETDTWQINVSFARSASDEQDDGYEPEEKYCVLSLPAGVDISHQTGALIPLFLPSLVINAVYHQPEQDSYIQAEITPPPARQEEICLLTGECLVDSGSSPEHNFPSAFEWPSADWKQDISQSLSCEEVSQALFSRSVSLCTHWRSRNISSTSVLSAFSYEFPNSRLWTPDFINEGDEDAS